MYTHKYTHTCIYNLGFFGLRNSDLTISGFLRWTHQPLVPILQQAGSAKGWAQSSLQLLIKKKKKKTEKLFYFSLMGPRWELLSHVCACLGRGDGGFSWASGLSVLTLPLLP